MAPNPNAPSHTVPDAVDDVPANPDTMFPEPSAGELQQKKDASVGIEDPRKEVATPEGISAPFADDSAAPSTGPPPDGQKS
jgi:hypothetical protein